ncbi:MAG: radical SAM protein [bacterium]|nr:radical SAM protein [bacterium]
MTRIILISPPGLYRDTPDPNGLPLGLVMLATMAREIADVEIIDSYSLALPVSETIDRVTKSSPDMVGISLQFSFSEPAALEIAKGIKISNPEIPMIFGGIQATARSKSLICSPFVDAIAMGEFDIGFQKIIAAFNSGGWENVSSSRIPNLMLNEISIGQIQRQSEFIDNLDSLPMPDFTLLPGFPQKYNPRLLTSRGCKFRCPYCASAAYWGHRFRAHSPERVVEEMHGLKNKWGIKRVSFSDDTFNLVSSRSAKIAELLIDSGLEMKWGASMRPELLTEDDLRLYIKSGLTGLFLGLESGSPAILKKINRNHNLDKTRDLVILAQNLGVEVHASFMIGLPDETDDDIQMTIEYAVNLPSSSLGFHIFHPLPGSEYGDHPEKYEIEIIADGEGVGEIDAVAPIRTKHLNPMRILDYYYMARGVAEERQNRERQ